MSLKTYLVNLDYESELFDPNYKEFGPKYLKVIREFEYVFFLINKEECILKNIVDYEESYLRKLTELGFYLPNFNSKALTYEKWWGKCQDLTLEKKLNSKLTSFEIGKKNNWGSFEAQIATDSYGLREYLSLSNHQKFILKNPFGFSGNGNQLIFKNFEQFSKLNYPLIVEPKYDRIFDLGITFLEDKSFLVINTNDDRGGFKGGVGAKSPELMFQYIQNKFNFNLKENFFIYQEIFDEYKKIAPISSIQIDSFVYLDQGEMKLYPLVEVNYRRTMGQVINSLVNITEKNYVQWSIVPNKDVKNAHDGIVLSPKTSYFNTSFRSFDIIE